MTTLCVHCNEVRDEHCQEQSYMLYACPVYEDGFDRRRIGWHPVHRFTARSGEATCSHGYVKAIPGALECQVCKSIKPDGAGQWRPAGPAVQTGSQPEWRELGIDEEIAHGDEVAHSRLENWAPITDSVWLTPTAYPCLKFRRRVEPPQPAPAAGEKCKCGQDGFAISGGTVYCSYCLKQLLVTLTFGEQQPCPRCAELERERDEALEAMRAIVRNVEQPELKGASTLVLYFPTDADREELIAAFKEAKPNCKTIKL